MRLWVGWGWGVASGGGIRRAEFHEAESAGVALDRTPSLVDTRPQSFSLSLSLSLSLALSFCRSVVLSFSRPRSRLDVRLDDYVGRVWFAGVSAGGLDAECVDGCRGFAAGKHE